MGSRAWVRRRPRLSGGCSFDCGEKVCLVKCSCQLVQRLVGTHAVTTVEITCQCGWRCRKPPDEHPGPSCFPVVLISVRNRKTQHSQRSCSRPAIMLIRKRTLPSAFKESPLKPSLVPKLQAALRSAHAKCRLFAVAGRTTGLRDQVGFGAGACPDSSVCCSSCDKGNS